LFSFTPKKEPRGDEHFIKENAEWVVHYGGQQKQPSSGGLVFSCVVTAIRRRRIKINVSVCASFCAGPPVVYVKNRTGDGSSQKKKRTKERKQKVARSYRSKNGECGNTVKK
jgi:hypothetical protein